MSEPIWPAQSNRCIQIACPAVLQAPQAALGPLYVPSVEALKSHPHANSVSKETNIVGKEAVY